MEYSVGAAIGAGLLATAIMTVVLYMGIGMMPRQMTMNLLYMLGTMVTRNKGMAYIMGAIIHGAMGVIFALIHTGLYQSFGLESGLAGWGLVFGFAHWVIVGVGMGMVGSMHQLMRAGEMDAPGVFVVNYPMMTRGGFLMLHLLYGLLVGLFYEAFVV